MGVMFAQINWTEWIAQFTAATSTSVKNRCHAILLNLTVHLSTDIVAREVRATGRIFNALAIVFKILI
jgi:hypothetical protein